MTDGPVQQRYKQVVLAALGQPSTDQITALATEHTKHSGTAPLRELMFSVPAQVVAGLSGLDEPAALEASRLVADFVQCIPASATPEQQAGAARAAAALRSLLGPALTEDNAGMLGELVRTAYASGWTELEPLLANGIGLLSQTYDATAGLIGNTIVTLARELGPDRCHSASECFALTRDVREAVQLMIGYLRRPDLLDVDWVAPWLAAQ